ncbi:hypothetical protein F2Q70_00023826 [Brassica cretica]|uniref:FHA domain-containing protein n=1 Tax=Brassica cretica TaxID=69181 RepID=A0A8S9GN86_BRACR|nr:hypothetical protein F2Q70_00023826 [Brassica cretica]
MASAVGGGSDVEVGFAKLQGEDFEYYMQSYSIMLGRNSKKSTVDVDLSSLGGGMNISRNHARIFYDFTRRRFSLECALCEKKQTEEKSGVTGWSWRILFHVMNMDGPFAYYD